MSCPSCFSGGAATSTPTGTTQTLHGHTTYIASAKSPSTNTLILYTDAFGHLIPNNLLLADALSTALHTTVLVPDLIPGGAMSPAVLPLMDTFTSPTSSYLGKALAMARAMVYVLPFFARAAPTKSACTAASVAFANAVRKETTGRVGLVGYCWGGYQALHIAGREERVADAVFVAHPAAFEARQVLCAVERGVKVAFAHAGLDMSLPSGRVEELKGLVEGSEAVEVRVYEGCGHGFAVRASPGNGREGEAAAEALAQAVAWFGKWL